MRKTKLAVIAALAAPLGAAPLAAADLDNGRSVYKACKACHSLDAGRRKIGPSLHGIFGREAGAVESFRYSRAMKAADVTWTEETLREYLRDPRRYIKGTRMAFAGVKSEKDLDDLIAYIKEATK